MSKWTSLRRKGFTLIELMIVVAIIGILAAIAIPNFIKFQAKSKQSEAKTGLKSVFTAEKSLFGEKDIFSNRGDIVGFSPEKGNRYYYRLDATCAGGTWTRDGTAANSVGPAAGYSCITQQTDRFGTATPTFSAWTAALTGNAASTEGVNGTCPSCGFSASATGNVDNDAKYDSWFISSGDATSTTANCGNTDTTDAAGVPYNNYNDVACD